MNRSRGVVVIANGKSIAATRLSRPFAIKNGRRPTLLISTRFQMETNAKNTQIRPLIRWLAGVLCLLFFYGAFAMAFPKMIGNKGQASLTAAASLVSCGLLFASLAAKGRPLM
jgi:hypothetical protein